MRVTSQSRSTTAALRCAWRDLHFPGKPQHCVSSSVSIYRLMAGIALPHMRTCIGGCTVPITRRRVGRSSPVSKAENAEVAMAPPSSQQSRAQLMGAFSRHVQGKHSTSVSVVWFRCGEGGGCQGVLSACIGGAGWPLNTMCCVCVHYLRTSVALMR